MASHPVSSDIRFRQVKLMCFHQVPFSRSHQETSLAEARRLCRSRRSFVQAQTSFGSGVRKDIQARTKDRTTRTSFVPAWTSFGSGVRKDILTRTKDRTTRISFVPVWTSFGSGGRKDIQARTKDRPTRTGLARYLPF